MKNLKPCCQDRKVWVHLKRVKKITVWCSPFYACEMSAEKNVEQSCPVWEQALKAAIFLAEFSHPSPDLMSGMGSKPSKLGQRNRPTTLKSRISSISTIETRPFWPYSHILWKVAHRNARCECIILVPNIIWRSGHAIRSSSLLGYSFLHHIC